MNAKLQTHRRLLYCASSPPKNQARHFI